MKTWIHVFDVSSCLFLYSILLLSSYYYFFFLQILCIFVCVFFFNKIILSHPDNDIRQINVHQIERMNNMHIYLCMSVNSAPCIYYIARPLHCNCVNLKFVCRAWMKIFGYLCRKDFRVVCALFFFTIHPYIYILIY